jgi:hypothetical protein
MASRSIYTLLTALAHGQNTPRQRLNYIMAEDQAAHHLLNVLEERGLNVDLDNILLGFEDEDIKHETATWVEEYLHEDTLLTTEELELYITALHVACLSNTSTGTSH